MQLSMIHSALNTSQYAMTMTSPGTGASLASLDVLTMPLLQLWQITSTGQLLSALNSTWAVTASTTSNAVTVQPLTANNPAQVWQLQSFGPSQALVNQRTGMALTAQYNEAVLIQAALTDARGQMFQTQNPFTSDSWMLTTITNNTPNNLFVSGEAQEGSSALNAQQLPFMPGASLTFWSYYLSGLRTVAQIWDPRFDGPVGTFAVHLNWRDKTWIDGVSASNGYSIPQTSTVDPPNHDSPGLGTASISYLG